MKQVSRDNHFVPKFYLKQWSDDGVHIWAYRLLVSHENVPKWDYRSINKTAYLRDLYTVYEIDDELDEFEKWIAETIERPAAQSLKKVVKNNPLNSQDWNNLIMLLALQDVRTPLSYEESVERWEKTLPDLMESTIKKALAKYKNQKKTVSIHEPSKIEDEFFKDIVDIEFLPGEEGEDGDISIKTEILAGRNLWLKSQELFLKKTAEALKGHKWGIVTPASGHKWSTSDHPVVKLNYYAEGRYDFKGGWGSENTDIFMPLSPKHLLFTEIGKGIPEKSKLNAKTTKQFQSFITDRALRWIFADHQSDYIIGLRPRVVNAELYKKEAEQWENWNKNQYQAERNRKKKSVLDMKYILI